MSAECETAQEPEREAMRLPGSGRVGPEGVHDCALLNAAARRLGLSLDERITHLTDEVRALGERTDARFDARDAELDGFIAELRAFLTELRGVRNAG